MSDIFEYRRQWFNEYVQRVEHGVIEPPRLGVRYVCPCCGYPTLSERGNYDICELCNWEDDGQDDPHADEVWGGPNGDYSLSEARQNFQQNLIMYSPDKPTGRIGGTSNTHVEEQAKRAIMTAFDAMIRSPDQLTVGDLWRRVFDNEAILESELNRTVQEYERRAKSSDLRVRPNQ